MKSLKVNPARKTFCRKNEANFWTNTFSEDCMFELWDVSTRLTFVKLLTNQSVWLWLNLDLSKTIGMISSMIFGNVSTQGTFVGIFSKSSLSESIKKKFVRTLNGKSINVLREAFRTGKWNKAKLFNRIVWWRF